MLLGDAPKNLNAGQHIEAAIEPAAVRHRIHMAADQKRVLGVGGQAAEFFKFRDHAFWIQRGAHDASFNIKCAQSAMGFANSK